MRIQWTELQQYKTKTFYKGEFETYKAFVRELNRPFQVVENSWGEKPKGFRGTKKKKDEEEIDLSGLKF